MIPLNPQGVNVRRADVEDVPYAIPLVQEFVDESIQAYGFQLDENVVLRNFVSFVEHAVVAYDNSRMVGVLAGKVHEFDLSGQEVFQEHIWYVSREYRTFVGPRLLDFMEDLLAEKGVKFMVMVHLGNGRADVIAKYYERLGYRPLETHYIKQL
jgi:hypothetical protein